MSITLKDLREYRTICAEIDMLNDKLKRDKRHVYDTVQSAADFPYWKHSVMIEGDIHDYDVTPVVKHIFQLRDRKARLERFVATVPDYKVRRAMEVCFIEPCDGHVTWEMVADAMGDGSNGNSIRQLVWKYMERR